MLFVMILKQYLISIKQEIFRILLVYNFSYMKQQIKTIFYMMMFHNFHNATYKQLNNRTILMYFYQILKFLNVVNAINIFVENIFAYNVKKLKI